MTKGRQCALIICLGLVWLAFGLRLWRLDAQPLHGDEAFSVLFSSYPLGEMFQSMGTTEPNPPLYWLTLRAWMSLAGRSEFAVRFLSVLFSTATVALLYPFGQRLFGQRIGVLVAFLGAINPFYLWYAQETRMYTMVAALSLASLVFFLTWGQPGRAGHRSRIGLVVTTALALYTHYFATLIWLVQNILFCLTPGWRSTLRTWLRIQAISVTLFAPWLVFVAPSLITHKKVWIAPISLGAMIERVITVYGLGTTLPEAMAQPLWIAFLLLALVGLAIAFVTARRSGLVVALTLLVPLLVTYLFSLRRPAFHERYLIGIVPAYLALLALGIAAPYAVIRPPSSVLRRLISGLALALVLYGSVQSLYHYHYDPAFAKAPDWRGLVRGLQARMAPSDLVIQNYPDPALPYYLGPSRSIALPARNPLDPLAEHQTLRAVLDTYDHVWFLPDGGLSWDPGGFIRDWLDRRAERVWQGQIAGFEVIAYRRAPPPVPSHPLDWRLGENIRLVGYDFAPVGRQGEYRLSLYWACLAPVSTAYSVFTHVLDRTGQLVTQHDSWPQQGAFPTSIWLPGDIIRDEHPLTLPASLPLSDLTIEVGLYEAESGRRLPVFAPDGQRIAGDQIFIRYPFN